MGIAVEGYVAKKFSRKTKNPKFSLHSFKLEGDDKYYSTKFDELSYQEGDYITFLYEEEQNGKYTNNEVDKDSIKKKDAPKAAAGGAGAPAGGAVGREQYWANKEARDVVREKLLSLQGCRSQAIDIVKLGLEKGYIPEVDKAKKAEQLDVLLAVVDRVAHTLLDGLIAYSTGDEVVEDDDQEPDIDPAGDWEEEDED